MNILDELKDAKIVGITGHVRPDGDCVGSTMGLYNFLKVNRPDLDVRVFLQKPGEEFNYIPRIEEIRHETDVDLVCDIFVVLDCSSLDRIEPFAELFCNAKKTIC